MTNDGSLNLDRLGGRWSGWDGTTDEPNYPFDIVDDHVPLLQTRPYKSALSESAYMVKGMYDFFRQVAPRPRFECRITNIHEW